MQKFEPGAIAAAILRYRWVALFVSIALCIGGAAGLPKLQFEANYRYFFSKDNPDLQAFDAFQATYTKNDNIFFILRDAERDIFDREILAALEKLTNDAWSIPHATRVDSITNFQRIYAEGDDLVVEDLISGAAAMPAGALKARKNIALSEPVLVNNLISPDGRTAGVNVTLQFPEKSENEIAESVERARAFAQELRTAFPNMRVALTGIAMTNTGFVEAGERDAGTLIPLMYLLMIILVFISVRSLLATLAVFFVIVLSTVAGLGVAGHLGIKLAPIAVAAPNVILTLAVANCIHVITGVKKGFQDGLDKSAAIARSLSQNMTPIFVTSLTTIIGFLSLNFSDAPPFRALGNISAIGIAAAWLLAILFVPSFLSLVPMKPPAKGARRGALNDVLDKIAEFVIRRPAAIVLTGGVATITMVSLATTNELNDAFLEYFDERLEIRRDLDFGVETLKTPDQMEFSLRANGPGGVSDPSYLETVEKFSDYLRKRDDVMHVITFTDTLKRINRAMNGDDPEFYHLPQSKALAAQFVLLYEMSLPYGLDLNDRLNIDKSATRVTATLHKRSAAEQRAFIAETEAWLRENTPGHMWTRPTGVTVMMDYVSLRNAEGMIQGTAIAIFLIAVTAALAFRSAGLGALSILPNVAPAMIAFGVWALIDGMIGMAASVILATTLGVVVDDTIHFLSKYLLARRDKGMSRADAIRYAFRLVGDAIVKTSIILAIGFGLLATSAFGVNAQLGVLTAIAIVAALAFDLFVLPAILLMGDPNSVAAKQGDRSYAPQRL